MSRFPILKDLLSPLAKKKIVEEAAEETSKKSSKIKPLAGLGAGGLAYSSTVGPGTLVEETQDPTFTDQTKPEYTETKLSETSQPEEKDKKKEEEPLFMLGESREEKDLNKRINNTLNSYDKLENPPVTSSDLRNKMTEDLKKLRDNREASLMWGQLAERFLTALTKYGAAREGINRGLDMSRVEVERTDWNSMINNAYKNYKEDLSQLLDQFGKEDVAKEKIDKARTEKEKEIADLKTRMARLKDAREAEIRRVRERRREQAASAEERELDRQARKDLEVLKASKKGMKEDFDQVSSEFTTDPATMRELYTAALMGKSELKAALKRAGVADKLIPAALDKYSNKTFFGLGSKKLDVGDVRDKILEEGQEQTTGLVEMITPDGRIIDIPSDKVKEMESYGARRR